MDNKELNFDWETEEEQLSRYLRVPVQKRLEWLNEMHQFVCGIKKEGWRAAALELKRRQSLGGQCKT